MLTEILLQSVGEEEESFLGSFAEVAILMTTITLEQKLFITQLLHMDLVINLKFQRGPSSRLTSTQVRVSVYMPHFGSVISKNIPSFFPISPKDLLSQRLRGRKVTLTQTEMAEGSSSYVSNSKDHLFRYNALAPVN